MNVNSGEPVPPGFEDEVNRVPEIKQAIDQYKGNALIGLEYTIELYEEDREPGYICVLCDKRADPRNIMQHWTSFNHRVKYLEKHYQTAMRECNSVKYKPNFHNIMILVVQNLAEAIEDYHGRLGLSVYDLDEFRRMKSKIYRDVFAKFHYDERNGPNFLNIIDRTLDDKIKPKKLEKTIQITIKTPKRIGIDLGTTNKHALDEISSDSDASEMSKRVKKRKQSPSVKVLPRVRRSPPFEEERIKDTEKMLPTPKELSMQASHIAQERYKLEKFICIYEMKFEQMKLQQEEYDKNPEKHPRYQEEWNKFWNRRHNELKEQKNVDPYKYDYNSEWSTFWTERAKEIFSEDVDNVKKEIKKQLGIPHDSEQNFDQLRKKYKVQISNNVTKQSGSAAKKESFGKSVERVADIIDISDDEESSRRSKSRSVSQRPLSLSPSPHRDYGKRHESQSPIDYDRHYSRHRSSHKTVVRPYPPVETDYYGSSATYARSRFLSSHHYAPHATSYRVMDSHQYPKYEKLSCISPTSKTSNSKEEPEVEEEDGTLTVVAVLRLLTALEEHLGSLGPKVVDLLGKALALEKVKANSADDLLINDDHCVFFETIKEKLKGLLIADVIEDHQKVRAVKKAIKNIATLIHQVNTKGDDADVKNENKNDTAVEDNGKIKTLNKKPSIKDLPFDRQIVATKLAAALVLQGREDVSTEDMDKLIFVFLLMVKLSKANCEINGQYLRMKNILPELGIRISQPATPVLAGLPGLVDEFIEKQVSAFVEQVEDEISNDTSDKDSKSDNNSSMLESLTDSDLQTLLQNFKHLSVEEQHHLIAHLKKLEHADPARVEKLRKYVDLGDLVEEASTSSTGTSKNSQSSKTAISNVRGITFQNSPAATSNNDHCKYSDEENSSDKRRSNNIINPNKFSLDDDDDDDYNFEDVFKAVSSNVNRNKDDEKRTQTTSDDKLKKTTNEPIVPVSSSPSALTFNPAGLNISFSDTQNLIANLMGSLQQSKSKLKNINNNAQVNEPKPVPILTNSPAQQQNQSSQQPQQQHIAQNNMSYYQQAYGSGYNMPNAQTASYYNQMNNYNNSASGYSGYQQWGNNQPMGNMSQFGVQNYEAPQMQPQQQQQSYMYGHNGN